MSVPFSVGTNKEERIQDGTPGYTSELALLATYSEPDAHGSDGLPEHSAHNRSGDERQAVSLPSSPRSALQPTYSFGSDANTPSPRSASPQQWVEHDTRQSKTYSFVALPGNAVRKRPRRRFNDDSEIGHFYHCSWVGCTKSYGTLNHLNAHIAMQRHGNKRTPAEFKEAGAHSRTAETDRLEPPSGPSAYRPTMGQSSPSPPPPDSNEI